MDITAYVLIIRDESGSLHLGEGRQGVCDLPVGFEPRYADFLFEFAESRIHCALSDEVLLVKGCVNTDDIEKSDNFIEDFKNRLKYDCDFSHWEVVRAKQAMSLNDHRYQQRLLNHLKQRHSSHTKNSESDPLSETG